MLMGPEAKFELARKWANKYKEHFGVEGTAEENRQFRDTVVCCLLDAMDDFEKESRQFSVDGYKETIKEAQRQAIERQEQELREEYNSGQENAYIYVLEMLDKHRL